MEKPEETMPSSRREGTAVSYTHLLYEQALRRIRTGKCFHQPELGMREFVCDFEESDGTLSLIHI